MNRFEDTSLLLNQIDRLSLDDCVLRGFEWFRNHFIPMARNLCRPSARGAKTAWILELTGDVYFVIDCVAEAVRWYRRASQKSGRKAELERQIADAQSIMERVRARTMPPVISPSGDSRTELTKMEQKGYLQACEAIALGRPVKHRLGNDSEPWLRLLHARWLATAGQDAKAFREFHSAIINAEDLYLTAADWFYLPASCWEYTALWRTLHRRRRSITSLGLANFDRASERVGPPELSRLYGANLARWSRKARDLVLRFHLYRTRGDRAALQRLAADYPKWGDVVLTMRHYDTYGRAPLKQELLDPNR